ncbi:RNA methyltransferase [bacterium]|nr:RNA methyltransferase [bacterium]
MNKKNKKLEGELIFGVHPLLECLRARRRKVISIYTTKPTPKSFALIEREMPKYKIPIQYVSRDILQKMAGSTDHQGIVSWVRTFPFRKKVFDSQKQKFIVMLDGIQDPRNVGAIIRSAYCAGAQGVVLCKKGASPLSAVALKASAGLAEHMEILLAPSSEWAAQTLKEAGYNLYMAVFNGKSAIKVEYKEPLCLVIGNEAIGVTKGIMRMGTNVTLPQRSDGISYNASVAAGILLFHIGVQSGRI